MSYLSSAQDRGLALLRLAGDLVDPRDRRGAARRLAVHLGARDLIVFIPDPDLGVHLPAPGFPRTLSSGRWWRRFLERCAGAEYHRDVLLEGSAAIPALGVSAEDRTVAVLIGGEPREDELPELRLLLPLLAAGFRGELASEHAAGQAALARESAAQARALAQTLEAVRVRLQEALEEARAHQAESERRARALEETTRALGATNAALEASNRELQKQAEEALRARLEAESAKGRLADLATTLEERVTERTQALDSSYRQLEAFSYSVSHDLRAPLRALAGYATVLLEDCAAELPEVGREYCRRIARAAYRMDRLIRDLLEVAQVSRMHPRTEAVAVRAAIGEALEQVGPELRERGAVLEIAAEGVVAADRTTLVQVLANLLSNAAKFVTAGVRPHIRVTAEDRGHRLRVSVRDNGLGIAPAYHERIFGVFERLHRQEDYEGTGVGLAIVRQGVELMGGRVGLDSEVGKGSTFWIELPRA